MKSKRFFSPNYNFIFDAKTGFFARWGKTKEDDPNFSPIGPEILDIEISTICKRACKFCYKSNTAIGHNMPLETFKQLFSKFPKTLTQIAFGIGQIDGNPDLWDIMQHCRDNNVVPNITVNGDDLTAEHYDKLASMCGAVAVSLYAPDRCYEAVQALTSRGLQTNIHALLSAETMPQCERLLDDMQSDSRLAALNAAVFLWLKPKGDRNTYHQVNQQDYQRLVDKAMKSEARFGFDSCSAPMFLEAIKNHPKFDNISQMVEPCESTLFSYYINAEGVGFPCSFCEEQIEGINILVAKNFLLDVWNNPVTEAFRTKCLACSRKCIAYKLGWK